MKKLLTIAMISLAALAAKADLYLYWTIDAASASQFDYQIAALVGGEKAIGLMTGTSTAMDTAITDTYVNYWVALYDSARNEVARSKELTFADISSSTWEKADIQSNPGVPAYTFGSFTAVGAIPEPTSGLMLLLGLGALALKRKLA